MFINSTQLKKLMKREYRDVRLTIGNIDGGYSIMGSTWIVHIMHDGMPNIVKSLIIELAGILPAEGEILTISKENPSPQYEMDTGEGRSIHLIQRYRISGRPAFWTSVYEERNDELYGLIQSNLSGELCHVRKELLDLMTWRPSTMTRRSCPGTPAIKRTCPVASSGITGRPRCSCCQAARMTEWRMHLSRSYLTRIWTDF